MFGSQRCIISNDCYGRAQSRIVTLMIVSNAHNTFCHSWTMILSSLYALTQRRAVRLQIMLISDNHSYTLMSSRGISLIRSLGVSRSAGYSSTGLQHMRLYMLWLCTQIAVLIDGFAVKFYKAGPVKDMPWTSQWSNTPQIHQMTSTHRQRTSKGQRIML